MRPRFDPPLPLLVTGVTGVAGYNAFRAFRRRYGEQVWAIRQHSNWRIDWPGVVACDAEDSEALNRLFDEYGFRGVLDCAGNCALKSCELDPTMAWRLNVEGPTRLAEIAAARGIPLVRLSIDLVYSGTRGGGHVESDWTDPVTVYGKTMVEAEQVIAAIDPTACILRISLPMGVSASGHAGAIDWI
ncbi:MAG: sugar nucleotide-binding protein, partial [Planctomycetales bacterium]|nr:sugar nucleotide-binding protein [Planctomycetales bacterium]